MRFSLYESRTAVRLTPMMETCLRAMARGELIRGADGWRSSLGLDGVWNSHTVGYLRRRGFCFVRGEKRAVIAGPGRMAIGEIDGVAA